MITFCGALLSRARQSFAEPSLALRSYTTASFDWRKISVRCTAPQSKASLCNAQPSRALLCSASPPAIGAGRFQCDAMPCQTVICAPWRCFALLGRAEQCTPIPSRLTGGKAFKLSQCNPLLSVAVPSVAEPSRALQSMAVHSVAVLCCANPSPAHTGDSFL